MCPPARPVPSLLTPRGPDLTMHHTIEERHIFPNLAKRMPSLKADEQHIAAHHAIHEGACPRRGLVACGTLTHARQGSTSSGRCSTSGARSPRRTRRRRCARVSTAGAGCSSGISTRRCVARVPNREAADGSGRCRTCPEKTCASTGRWRSLTVSCSRSERGASARDCRFGVVVSCSGDVGCIYETAPARDWRRGPE